MGSSEGRDSTLLVLLQESLPRHTIPRTHLPNSSKRSQPKVRPRNLLRCRVGKIVMFAVRAASKNVLQEAPKNVAAHARLQRSRSLTPSLLLGDSGSCVAGLESRGRLHFLLLRVKFISSEQKANIVPSLFPQLEPTQPLVGIARLAAQGEALAEGHEVEYLTLENRSVLTRCNSTRMPFQWMINPYRGCEFACKYCYARYTHEFMELRDGLDFERKIYVKQHTTWLLRQELRKVRPGESIAMGTATDPYQPAERKFGITRSILEEIARHQGLKLGIVTKSNLVLRDLELLQAIAGNNRLTVVLTVTTVKTDLARILEPRAPRPDLRLEAIRRLTGAGIHAGVNCAPVLPGITDAPRDLENLVRAAAEAGAHFVNAQSLFLKPCSAKVFLPFLKEKFPDLVAAYEKRYSEHAFVSAAYQKRISTLVGKYRSKYGIGGDRWRMPERGSAQQHSSDSQLGLFK